MAVTTRLELKEYCLRKLGKPVININVDDTQVEDRVDEALETFQEKHYDATERDWVYYELTQTDLDNGWVAIPDDILVVIGLLPFSEIAAQADLFSYQYQLALKELSPWRPLNQLDYYMKVTNYESINDMTSVTPTFDFSKHAGKLKIFEDLKKLGVGYKLAVHVQRIIDPAQVPKIYNDKWLKEFTTALVKRQWGENLKKMSGITLLGGVELNGQQIFDEAMDEIAKLEENLEETYMLPNDFIVG
jgi:hypothetical protein